MAAQIRGHVREGQLALESADHLVALVVQLHRKGPRLEIAREGQARLCDRQMMIRKRCIDRNSISDTMLSAL